MQTWWNKNMSILRDVEQTFFFYFSTILENNKISKSFNYIALLAFNLILHVR